MERIGYGTGVAQLAEPGQKVWHILDFWHACDHLGTISKVLYGEGSEQFKRSFKRWRSLLRKGCVAAVIKELQELHASGRYMASSSATTSRARSTTSRPTSSAWTTPLYRSCGLPIGSGVQVEGACKNVVAPLPQVPPADLVVLPNPALRQHSEAVTLQHASSIHTLLLTGPSSCFWGRHSTSRIDHCIRHFRLASLRIPTRRPSCSMFASVRLQDSAECTRIALPAPRAALTNAALWRSRSGRRCRWSRFLIA